MPVVAAATRAVLVFVSKPTPPGVSTPSELPNVEASPATVEQSVPLILMIESGSGGARAGSKTRTPYRLAGEAPSTSIPEEAIVPVKYTPQLFAVRVAFHPAWKIPNGP